MTAVPQLFLLMIEISITYLCAIYLFIVRRIYLFIIGGE